AAVAADPLPGAELPAPAPARATALIPIWRRPWMTMSAGTYGSSMLAHLGVINVFADASDRYPTFTLADASGRRPDIVVAPSEPYPFSERHREELEQVAPVVFVDGQDLFWWGVRTPSALARLAAVLEPITTSRPSPPRTA
ncbi:MAG: hypothetical protein QOK06_2377, partial [Acidimicrobiaceae bacterium]